MNSFAPRSIAPPHPNPLPQWGRGNRAPHPNPLPQWGRGNSATRRAFLRDLARLGGSAAGLGLLAGCAPAPPPAAPPRAYRVGLLRGPRPAQVQGERQFWERLAELGYVEGQNLIKEERFGVGDTWEYDELAAAVVGLPVDVIVLSGGNPTIRAVMAATRSIPIVLMGGTDTTDNLVEAGLIESLARPGGNLTGVTGGRRDLDLKRLQLLVDAVPGISRVLVLGGGPPLPEGAWEAAARSLGVDLLHLWVSSRDGYESAFERAVAQGADALLVQSFNVIHANADLIVSLAARHGLPAIYTRATAGGLMTYTARDSDTQRRAAEYVDRILRGARPADLPIELPTHYDLIVNLQTARALGLTLPRAFLAKVDEFVEG